MKPTTIPLFVAFFCVNVSGFGVQTPWSVGTKLSQDRQFPTIPVVATKPALVCCTSSSTSRRTIVSLASSSSSGGDASPELKPVPPDLENIPIPFLEASRDSFIECYADSIAHVGGIEYTIGVPCDYCVAICYYDDQDQLVPVELDDDLMNDVFPLAESIVSEEYGEDLVLQRTPQTLTLVGELEEDEEDDEASADDEEDDEEDVEVLLTFEYRDQEFSLVRLLDPILLVGKPDESNPSNRILLDSVESERVMPILEEMFLDYNGDSDSLEP